MISSKKFLAFLFLILFLPFVLIGCSSNSSVDSIKGNWIYEEGPEFNNVFILINDTNMTIISIADKEMLSSSTGEYSVTKEGTIDYKVEESSEDDVGKHYPLPYTLIDDGNTLVLGFVNDEENSIRFNRTDETLEEFVARVR